MCGILGIIGSGNVASLVVAGLRRLEYRGYDSAGVATLVGNHIERRRAQGKLCNLSAKLEGSPMYGDVGIGHTRWATHGAPNEVNAHPHATDVAAVVHNGIIENYRDLRAQLQLEGCVFESETDTETIVHLLTKFLKQDMSPAEASAATFMRLEGAFSVAIIFAGHHDTLIGARRGSPLAVGYGKEGMFLASDAIALAPFTSEIAYLQEGDWVELTRKNAVFHNSDNTIVDRAVQVSYASSAITGKGGHRHFMHKEICEQPTAIGDTLHALLDPSTGLISLPAFTFDLSAVPQITIVACGTGYYASMVAKYWIEQLARITVEVDIASEFRYRNSPLIKGGLAIFVSQSGETADTLEALRYARRSGQFILSIVNVPESTIAREADAVIYTNAGPEICVASTKATTCQLTVLACFAIALANARNVLNAERERDLTQMLSEVPGLINQILVNENAIVGLARLISAARDALYMGRGSVYPIAMEGALKLKEISYIHAEGYAAGELKHGPIALIDDDVPVIVLAPYDDLFPKVASNVQEVVARGGKVILFSCRKGIESLQGSAAQSFEMPAAHPLVTPILYSLPVQLLAYHVAVLKGTDVDQPRNLAKSVTVE